MEDTKDDNKVPGAKGGREDDRYDSVHEDTRAGGEDWGTHDRFNRDDAEDGRRSEIPTSRGGGNCRRYDDLVEED